ncbi:cdc42 effector protein 2 [Ambystoma mexicanum]|uniref:cdc42 effector protein 2 n=1 Tax=Ambystoma mexicanum TaxID=8296 RepID=UPI0037E8B3F8
MSTKAPIYLKRGSRKGKKEKLRDILSSDMISPPLGDFRHTIHIGSGGESDMFGDISFLQGKFHLLPQTEGSRGLQRSSQYEVPFEFLRTATVAGHEQAKAENSSPILKNAISLPFIGDPQAVNLSSAQAPPPKPPRLHLEDKGPTSPVKDLKDTEGLRTFAELLPPSNSRTEQRSQIVPHVLKPVPVLHNGFPKETPGDETFLSHAGSMLSLHVDLGPSIMDDVLQIMDKHHAGASPTSIHEPGRQEILT